MTFISSAQTITTDKLDYPPGSTVIISGTGFQANETVQLQVLHIDANGNNSTEPQHQPWTVTADGSGNVASQWDLDEDALGATFKLTADGLTSGRHAETTFTDANFQFNASGFTTTPTITVNYRVYTTGSPSGAFIAITFTYPGPSSPGIAVSAAQTIEYTYNNVIISGVTYSAPGGTTVGQNGAVVRTITAAYAPACTAPTAMCKAATVVLDAAGNGTLTTAQVNNGSTAPCGFAVGGGLSLSKTSFNCSNLGANTVTLTVKDAANNASTCTATVTVVDDVAPVAKCKAATVLLSSPTLTTAMVDNTSTDNCAVTSLSLSKETFTCADISTNPNTVTLTVKDAANNASTCTTTVTVIDNIKPVITCPTNIALNTGSGICGAIVTYAVTATDNCSATVSKTSGLASGATFPVGVSPVAYTAVDPSTNSAACSFTVTVTDNENPVITCPANKIVSTDVGSCSATVSVGTATATDNCGATVAGVRSDAAVLTASYSFGTTTITWTATDAAGNKATCTQTITVNKVTTTTTVSVSPTTQQYSDKVIFTANVTTCSGAGANGGTVTFKVGTQIMGTVPVSTSGVATLTAALLETIAGTMSPSTTAKTVTAEYSGVGVYLASSATTPLTIKQENAIATFTGSLFLSTATTTSLTANALLSATIQDITAVSPLTDPDAGDIRKATVTFLVNGVACAGCSNLPVTLVNVGDTKTGIVAVANVPLTIGVNDDAVEFTIDVLVNGYYAGSTSGVVTVAKPLNEFITGGGYLVLTNSVGTKAGDVGSRTNFGFNIKYNKTGKNLQGNVNIIFRRTESDGILHSYQVKGNAMTSLTVPPGGIYASYTGKANLTDITNPLLPISLAGNLTIKMDVTDNGEPGSTDQVAISVFDGSSLLFGSSWSGTTVVQQTIAGGNIQVRTSANSSNLVVNNANNNPLQTAYINPTELTQEVVPVLKPQVTTTPSHTQDLVTVYVKDFKDGNATVRIYNLMQRIEGEWKFNVQNNKGQIELDLYNKMDGVYIIVVEDESRQQRMTQKVVKVNRN